MDKELLVDTMKLNSTVLLVTIMQYYSKIVNHTSTCLQAFKEMRHLTRIPHHNGLHFSRIEAQVSRASYHPSGVQHLVK